MSLIDQASPAESTEEPMIIDTGIEDPHGDVLNAQAAESTEAPAEINPADWYYAEGVKGEGNKPEWLKEKYKTAADQAKAYSELEKRLGAFKGAPEKYDLTIPGFDDVKFADNDPLLTGFIESAKKNGVSQEYVTELLGTYAKALTSNVPNVEAEMEKLGPSAQQDVQLLAQWGNTQFTPEEFNTFKGMLNTADSVRFFEKVRQMTTQADVAPPQHHSSTRETEEEVRQLVGDPRFATDPAFRKEVERRMAAAHGVMRK